MIIDTLFLWATSRIRQKTRTEEEKDSIYLEIAKPEGGWPCRGKDPVAVRFSHLLLNKLAESLNRSLEVLLKAIHKMNFQLQQVEFKSGGKRLRETTCKATSALEFYAKLPIKY